MRWMHQRVKVFDLQNVEVVKGEANNPKLPADSLAAVLVVNFGIIEHRLRRISARSQVAQYLVIISQ